jgi:hypothetical protein
MLHLQLWHPTARVSVLTPSRLTLGRYEAFPIGDWKFAHSSLRSIRGLVRSMHGVELPSAARIVAMERWYVGRLVLQSAPAQPAAPR